MAPNTGEQRRRTTASGGTGPLSLFCGRLERLRQAAGLTQSSLARAAQLSTTQMSDILNGKIKKLPDWDLVDTVVRACLDHAASKGKSLPLDLRDEDGRGNKDIWRRRYGDLEQDLESSPRLHGHGRRATRRAQTGRRAKDWDPFVLGIHKAVGDSPLPDYIRREHDDLLEAVLDPGVEANRLVVLRGGSSSGKSRSAYQSVCVGRLADWWLEYPLTPAGLTQLVARGLQRETVLWLGELRDYATANGGPESLEQLRSLLAERSRVIVITTLWPSFWDAYTGDYRGGPQTRNPYAAARVLLANLPVLTSAESAEPARGGVVDVSDELTAGELFLAAESENAAIAEAVRAVGRERGPARVIPYLAGAADLINHYEKASADPYGRAVITAAMAAARVSWGVRRFSAEFLERAAIGYLAAEHRTTPMNLWRDAAFEYATRELRGAVRALRPIPPAQGTGVAGYEIADFLEQYARKHTRFGITPPAFWEAALQLPTYQQPLLASTAEYRGLFRCAAQIAKNATLAGSSDAATLVRILRKVAPNDERPADWAIRNIRLNEGWVFRSLFDVLRDAGLQSQMSLLLDRYLAATCELPTAENVAMLLEKLREAGADTHLQTLLRCDPAARVGLTSTHYVASLLRELRAAHADSQVKALLGRFPAAQVPLGNGGVKILLQELRDAGDEFQAMVLARRASVDVDIANPALAGILMCEFREAGVDVRETGLLDRDPAARADFRFAGGISRLLHELCLIDGQAQIAELFRRDPGGNTDINSDPDDLVGLMLELKNAGAETQALALGSRMVDETDLRDCYRTVRMVDLLREAEEESLITALLHRRPAAHADLSDPYALGRLLRILREEHLDDQVVELLGRNPAACVDLVDAGGIAILIEELREAGEEAQVATLLGRNLAVSVDLSLDDQADELIGTLRKLGADRQADILLERLPGEGYFDLFCSHGENGKIFEFGREYDGRPAAAWGWEDLSL